ncbi:hypothetical protein PENTCL1PPCAC_20087, partial [Pristionchus entomophagus]
MHPVILQPGAPIPQFAWMDKPSIMITDIPSGLEYLVDIDFVRIRQLVEVEINTSLFIPNRYAVKNRKGEQIYITTEQPNTLRSANTGATRGFKFDMYDKSSRLAFRIERPDQDDSCSLCSCCSALSSTNRVKCIVESPVGTLAGVLFYETCSTSLGIRDGDGNQAL